MMAHFEDDFGYTRTVSMYGFSVLEVAMRGHIPFISFTQLWDQVRDLLQSKSYSALFVNARQVAVISPENHRWFIHDCLESWPQLEGCQCPIAIVNSEEFFGKIVVKRLLDFLEEELSYLNVRLFTDSEEAEAWVRNSIQKKQQVFPVPDNEEKRLLALHEYGILDTPPEEDFDELTALVAELLQVPMSMVTIIDKDRQWFKSRQGLDVDETPRELSFCQYAILQDEIYQVSNTVEHELFKDNPFVVNEPNIRFYAGAPLKNAEGYNLGTLCVLDRKPRRLTLREKEILKEYSREVVRLIEQGGKR